MKNQVVMFGILYDCYPCDTLDANGDPGQDGNPDDCYVCDDDSDGVMDDCYHCDTMDEAGDPGQDGNPDDCYVCDDDFDGTLDNCYQCDTDDDGIPDDCFVCDNDADGVFDDCLQCDTDDDGLPDDCYVCDNDQDGVLDDCLQCDTDDDGVPDDCFVCDNDQDGTLDDCHQCDTDDDGIPDDCYVCDNNDDGTFDDCFQCDLDGDGIPESCLSCDSNDDGVNDGCFKLDLEMQMLPEETEPTPNEENPGVVLCANLDDDDGNGVADSQDSGPLEYEDLDLERIGLSVYPAPASGIVKLNPPSFVRIWKDRYKHPTPTQWNLTTDTVPDFLYVEGLDAGNGFITLTYIGDNAACEDKVKIEVEKVEIIGTRSLMKTGQTNEMVATGGTPDYHWSKAVWGGSELPDIDLVTDPTDSTIATAIARGVSHVKMMTRDDNGCWGYWINDAVRLNLTLQGLGEETTPPPNEENPGAVLCVDTNGTAPRVPLSVHLNPGILTNGELRLEGPPASAVRVWNHFTETNAANIVTLPFITNLTSNASITTNFFVQALEPSETPTNLLFQLIFNRGDESVDDKAYAAAIGVAKIIATGEGDSADSTAEAPGNFLVATTDPTNHIALEAIMQPAVTSAPPNFVWNAVRLDQSGFVPFFTNNTLRTSFRRNLAGTYRVSAGCGSTNSQPSVELHIYGEDFHTCSVSCTLHGLPEFFCLGETHEIGVVITGATDNRTFIAKFKNGNVKFVTDQGGQEVLSDTQTITWPPADGSDEVKLTVRGVNPGAEKIGVFEDGKPEKPDPDYGILQNKTDLGGPTAQRDERKTNVSKVQSVNFVEGGTTGDLSHDNPNAAPLLFGGGWRFFPDATTPSGSTRNRVRVRAFVTPSVAAVTNLTVYFRAFDVDDPSASNVIDPNGNDGRDNRGTVTGANVDSPGTPQPPDANGYRGRLRPIDPATGQVALVPGTGQPVEFSAQGAVVTAKPKWDGSQAFAEVEMATSFQPGDNFRAVASCLQSEVQDLNETTDVPTTGDIANFRGAVTEQLAVWRHLTIELDSMQPIPSQKDPPDRKAASGSQWLLNTPANGQSTLHLQLASLTGPANFYAGGLIKQGNTSFSIVSHTPNRIVITGVPTPAQQALFIGFLNTFEVFDDDDRYLPPPYAPPLPRFNLITPAVIDKFKLAYIQVQQAGPALNPNQFVQFRLNEGTGNSAFGTLIGNARDVQDSSKFWAHRVVSCYQGKVSDDRDPDDNDGEFAATVSGEASAIFLEVIRDELKNDLATGTPANVTAFINRINDLVAHETAHPPGGQTGAQDHLEGGLMGDDAPNPVFFQATVRRLRKALHWQE